MNKEMNKLDRIILDALQKFPKPNDFIGIIEQLSLHLPENEKDKHTLV